MSDDWWMPPEPDEGADVPIDAVGHDGLDVALDDSWHPGEGQTGSFLRELTVEPPSVESEPSGIAEIWGTLTGGAELPMAADGGALSTEQLLEELRARTDDPMVRDLIDRLQENGGSRE